MNDLPADAMDLFGLWPLVGDAVWCSLIIAAGCSLLGVFVHVRRVVFVGVALSQAAACGIALSFLAEMAAWTAAGTGLAFLRNHTIMSLAVQLAIVALFTLWRDHHRITRDALIGIVYCAAGALAVLFVSQTAAGMDEIKTMISGDVLGATADDAMLLGLVLGAIVVVQLAGQNRFLLVAFDPEMAETLGIRTRLWDALFFLSLGVAIALAIRTTGTLFVFSYLVLPAGAALVVAHRVVTVMVWAVALGVAADFLGLWLSVRWDLPAGPTAAAAALGVFLGAVVWARAMEAAARRRAVA